MDNMTRAIRFETPDYIPMTFRINDACWHHYPKEALWDLMEEHKLLFPDFQRPGKDWMPDYAPVARKDAPYLDPMGCTWVTADNGITGSVKGHPLADWEFFSQWQIPDPDKTDGLYWVDWDARKREWETLKAVDGSFQGKLRHGHTFLQLCDLRGYENVLMDMMDEEPLLMELIEQLEAFNLAVVRHFVGSGCCSAMKYPEDLGMQLGPMLPPNLFRKYIQPSYRRIMEPAREAGIPIHMHSDGDIRTLASDLVESGVEILNLQDRVNGIDWIARTFRGKLCVEVDIDRQSVTPYGTPEQVDALVREAVSKIATAQGGLCMIYGLYPGIPLENVKALMDAMEKYAHYFG